MAVKWVRNSTGEREALFVKWIRKKSTGTAHRAYPHFFARGHYTTHCGLLIYVGKRGDSEIIRIKDIERSCKVCDRLQTRGKK